MAEALATKAMAAGCTSWSKPPLILKATEQRRQRLAGSLSAAISPLLDGARAGKLPHKNQLLSDLFAKVSPPWPTTPSSWRPSPAAVAGTSTPTVRPSLALGQVAVQPVAIQRQCENFSDGVDTAPVSCSVLGWSTARSAPRTPSPPGPIARLARDGPVRNPPPVIQSLRRVR